MIGGILIEAFSLMKIGDQSSLAWRGEQIPSERRGCRKIGIKSYRLTTRIGRTKALACSEAVVVIFLQSVGPNHMDSQWHVGLYIDA